MGVLAVAAVVVAVVVVVVEGAEEPPNIRSRRQIADWRGGRGVVVVISVGGLDSVMVLFMFFVDRCRVAGSV